MKYRSFDKDRFIRHIPSNSIYPLEYAPTTKASSISESPGDLLEDLRYPILSVEWVQGLEEDILHSRVLFTSNIARSLIWVDKVFDCELTKPCLLSGPISL